MRVFDAAPTDVKAALLIAFHEWKVRTRGRSGTYFEHEFLVDLDDSIWDRAAVVWEGNSFAIPTRELGRKNYSFSDVAAHREDLEEWINSNCNAPESESSEPRKHAKYAGLPRPCVAERTFATWMNKWVAAHEAASRKVNREDFWKAAQDEFGDKVRWAAVMTAFREKVPSTIKRSRGEKSNSCKNC